MIDFLDYIKLSELYNLQVTQNNKTTEYDVGILIAHTLR